jgi:hypothetical protein
MLIPLLSGDQIDLTFEHGRRVDRCRYASQQTAMLVIDRIGKKAIPYCMRVVSHRRGAHSAAQLVDANRNASHQFADRDAIRVWRFQ